MTRILFHNLILTLTVFLLSGPVRAAQGSVEALIDKTQGSLDDRFVVTLTINGKLKGDVEAPVIDGCEVVNSGVAQNMQWINGEFSSEVQHTFVIVPQREGTFTVPSWKLKVGGEDVTTLPLKFTVQGGAGSGQQPPNARQPSGQSAPKSADGDDLYIEREVPSRAPFVGEAFTSTVRVFHKVQMTAATPKRDSAPEFRMLSVPGDKTYQRVINGVRYQVVEFKEVLIPLKPGTHTIPPYRLQANILRPGATPRGGSVFDFLNNRFFGGSMGSLHGLFGREETVEVKGKPVSVTVKSLPPGAPAGFSGLVGEFSLTATPQEREVQAGDSVTVAVTVEGTGALDTLTLERVEDDLRRAGKVYPDKPTLKEEFKTDAAGQTELRSRKEFKLALVPNQQEGAVDLPAVSLVFFNPQSSSYSSVEALPGTIQVTPAVDRPASRKSPEAKGEQPESQPQRQRIPRALVTLILAVTGVGLAAAAWSRTRKKRPFTQVSNPANSPQGDVEDDGLIGAMEPANVAAGLTQSGVDALRISKEHFDAALREADAGMTGQALVSVGHGLRELLSAEAGRRVDAMTPREIRGLGVSTERADTALALLDQVEDAIFADRPVTRDFIHNLVERARLKTP
ncbi:MAG: hypothetical protein RIQ81_464 [Pseudomonadota bacterium]